MTFVATPGPVLPTTIVNVTVSPALYVPPSGVFWIVRCGRPIQNWFPLSVTAPALSATAVALFCSPGVGTQSAALLACVAVLTVTLQFPPTGKSPKLQLSTLLATVQAGLGVLATPALQVTVGLVGPQLRLLPLGTGRVSVGLKCTFTAVPGPVFVTTTVKLTVSPALYVVPSGVFWIVSTGCVMLTGSCPQSLLDGRLFASPV